MRRKGWGIFLALLAASCSAGGDVATYKSGSRLRAHVYETADGDRLLIDFFDTKLGVACRFMNAADGRMRCLPVDTLGAAFMDAQCSQPVAVTYDQGCGAPMLPYAVETATSGATCGDPGQPAASKIYTVGAALPVTTIYNAGPGCTPVSLGPTATVLSVTEADPATFVGADEAIEERGALGARVLRADDGAELAIGVYDVDQGARCDMLPFFEQDPLAPSPCAAGPLLLTTPQFFGDAACTTQLAAEDATCAKPTLLASVSASGEACKFDVNLSRPSVALDPTSTFMQAATCTPNTDTGHVFYAAGAPVDASEIPTVTPKAVGKGLLSPYVLAGKNGVGLGVQLDALVNTKLMTECTVTKTADGKLRCLPAAPEVHDGVNHYADAACTQELATEWPSCSSKTPPFGYRYGATASLCSDKLITETFTLGAQVSPSAIYSNGTGGCKPGQVIQDLMYFEVGAPGDLSVVPEVTELRE